MNSGLLADRFCGEDTELIYYMRPGSVISRTFTAKDTHSPKGDLLVVYTDAARSSYHDSQLAHATAAVLGFNAPSFTYGTDLMLPVEVNEALRDALLDGLEGVNREDEMSTDAQALEAVSEYNDISVPQVIAIESLSAMCVSITLNSPSVVLPRHVHHLSFVCIRWQSLRNDWTVGLRACLLI